MVTNLAKFSVTAEKLNLPDLLHINTTGHKTQRTRRKREFRPYRRSDQFTHTVLPAFTPNTSDKKLSSR